MRTVMVILWPSFVIAGFAEGVFFSLFDPRELRFFGNPIALSHLGAYTMGFVGFWLIGALSSAFTCLLQRGAAEVNR
jgi:hypothetical protein